MKDFSSWGVRIRKFPEYNYHAVWSNLRTLRLGQGQALELPPDKSEFFDIGINNKCNFGCQWCLPPESLIKTERGDVRIDSVGIGDQVLCFNETTHQIESKNIDQLYVRDYTGELIQIETDNNTICCTPNHKVYTENRGWIMAGNLTEFDVLLEI